MGHRNPEAHLRKRDDRTGRLREHAALSRWQYLGMRTGRCRRYRDDSRQREDTGCCERRHTLGKAALLRTYLWYVWWIYQALHKKAHLSRWPLPSADRRKQCSGLRLSAETAGRS